jgi:single-stranded DNA-binding protein
MVGLLEADQRARQLQERREDVGAPLVADLQQRSWTAEDGSARSVVEVVAEELGPSLRWATATTTRTMRSQGE